MHVMFHVKDKEINLANVSAYKTEGIRNQGWVVLMIGDERIVIHSLTRESSGKLADLFSQAARMLADDLDLAEDRDAEEGEMTAEEWDRLVQP